MNKEFREVFDAIKTYKISTHGYKHRYVHSVPIEFLTEDGVRWVKLFLFQLTQIIGPNTSSTCKGMYREEEIMKRNRIIEELEEILDSGEVTIADENNKKLGTYKLSKNKEFNIIIKHGGKKSGLFRKFREM